MSLISQFKWLTRAAVTLALLFALATTISAFASVTLLQLSSDPFTNSASQHATEVEPDTFAAGNTIVSAFQVGRIFGGGAADIGFATSNTGGSSFKNGFLSGTSASATPPGIYSATRDASVAFDARDGVWLISYLGVHPNGNPSEVDVDVSRSTDGGQTWSNPVVVNTAAPVATIRSQGIQSPTSRMSGPSGSHRSLTFQALACVSCKGLNLLAVVWCFANFPLV